MVDSFIRMVVVIVETCQLNKPQLRIVGKMRKAMNWTFMAFQKDDKEVLPTLDCRFRNLYRVGH